MIQGEQNRGRARIRIVWKEALSAKFGANIRLSGGRELDGDTLLYTLLLLLYTTLLLLYTTLILLLLLLPPS